MRLARCGREDSMRLGRGAKRRRPFDSRSPGLRPVDHSLRTGRVAESLEPPRYCYRQPLKHLRLFEYP